MPYLRISHSFALLKSHFIRPFLKNCLFAVTRLTHSKCHLPKEINGRIGEIIFFILILDIFLYFYCLFNKCKSVGENTYLLTHMKNYESGDSKQHLLRMTLDFQISQNFQTIFKDIFYEKIVINHTLLHVYHKFLTLK